MDLRRVRAELPYWILFFLVVGCLLAGVSNAEENTTVNITVTATPTPTPTLSAYDNFITAEPATNMQPTVVYYGEIVNVFNMIGWADQKGNYAMDYWFYNHTCGYRRADVVVDIARPRAVPVNRMTFPYEGVYYQHQIEGESGCTPVIEVRDGKRLANATEEKFHQENVTPAVVYDPWPELPDKPSRAAYLQARYQPINLTGEDGAVWLWLFSEREYLLQVLNEGNISSDQYEPGMYDIILQGMGNSSAIGVFYYEDTGSVRCACQPEPREVIKLPYWYRMTVLSALENEECSDDTYTMTNLELQEPAVDITDIFEVPNLTEEYTLYVQGYTNLAAGTRVNLTIDRERWDYHTLRAHTFNATVYGSEPGQYRKFRVKVPYDPDELKGGQHKLSALSPYGTETSVDFWVYEIPNGTPRPPAYLKYIDRNLWVPTPTPEVITKTETVVQTVENKSIVIVERTPGEEYYGKLVEAMWRGFTGNLVAALIAVGSGVLYVLAGYAVLVVIRAGGKVWKKK